MSYLRYHVISGVLLIVANNFLERINNDVLYLYLDINFYLLFAEAYIDVRRWKNLRIWENARLNNAWWSSWQVKILEVSLILFVLFFILWSWQALILSLNINLVSLASVSMFSYNIKGYCFQIICLEKWSQTQTLFL